MFDFRSLGGARRSPAVLASYGGGNVPSASSSTPQMPLERHHGSHTFNFAGRKQSFTVPAGVTRLTIAASGGYGAAGGGGGGFVGYDMGTGGPGAIGGGRSGDAGGGGSSFRGAAPGNGQIAVTW
ncbi:MAG TPA: hypothetical protein VN909_02985 [Candidatus Dormibacteraeota bacterium]|nr:hypothetical protein [Candidatus Dormibacteraeota bacterium]